MDNNLTFNNSGDDFTELIKEHFKKTQLVPFCVIMVVGIFTNAMVIVNGIQRRNTIKHYSNYFVLSMAFADFGVVSMQVPYAIFEFTLGTPNLDQFTCKYIIQIRETFQGATIFSVSLLALLRARQVMSYPNEQASRRTCAILVAAIWLISYLINTLPLYFIYKVFPGGYCEADWSSENFMKVYITLIHCLLLSPLLIASVSYTYVIMKIKKTLRLNPNEAWRKRNRSITFLLFALILSSWITYLPLAVYLILEIYTDVYFYGLYGWSIVSILYHGGSALNPVLVLVTMPFEYRSYVKCKREIRIDVPHELPEPCADSMEIPIESTCPPQSIELVNSSAE